MMISRYTQWEQLRLATRLQHTSADLNFINGNQRSGVCLLNSSPKVMDMEDASVIQAMAPFTWLQGLRSEPAGMVSGRCGPEAKCALRLQKPKIRRRIKEALPRIDLSGTA